RRLGVWRLGAPGLPPASSILIWMKPVDGEKAVCDQTKFTEWFTGDPRLWPQTFSVLVWLTFTSVELPLVLSAGSPRVHAPEVTVPPLGVQLRAPIVAWAPLLPSSPMVRPAVRWVAMERL